MSFGHAIVNCMLCHWCEAEWNAQIVLLSVVLLTHKLRRRVLARMLHLTQMGQYESGNHQIRVY